MTSCAMERALDVSENQPDELDYRCVTVASLSRCGDPTMGFAICRRDSGEKKDDFSLGIWTEMVGIVRWVADAGLLSN